MMTADRFRKKFTGQGSNISQCLYCQRWLEFKGARCGAFPERIPSSILKNEYDHREEHAGDHGKQFIAREGTKHPAED